ncbi:MAG: NAD(P)-binding protein [Thomasclavelia ramosa]
MEQKILKRITGGGPGGMYAAITARKRGYEVDLYEKEERLGYFGRQVPTFKHDVLKLITYLERQC